MSAAGTTAPQIGPGMIVARKRALFGLLDADGWAWAGVKAFIWLIIITLLLGYIPDRAYYLTVNRTVDLGLLVWSPINLCSSENESLPCPAPRGAIVPWHPSPPELALPAPRTDGTAIQLGTKILYVGGSDGTTAQSSVYVAELSGTGNFDKWAEGPALPEPRSDASVVSVSGTVYVIGGYDASGAPTTNAVLDDPGSTDRRPGRVDPGRVTRTARGSRRCRRRRVARPGCCSSVARARADRWRPPSRASSMSRVRSRSGRPSRPCSGHRPTPWPRWSASSSGCTAATTRRGRSARSSAVEFGSEAPEGQPDNPDEGKVIGWDVSNEVNLPVARDDAAGWTANGALYLIGGADAAGPQPEMYWSVPTNDGDITEWLHLAQSDLPVGVTGSSAFVTGPNAVMVGGETPEGPTTASVRANTAPQSPFFQLGPFGATVPGLKIDGEIGQQLGYLNAAGAGTVGFVVLVIVGWAFAHKPQARALVARAVRRGK